MGDTYYHNGAEILHGRTTESGEYQTTRVNGVWHFHPADSGWLSANGNADFSEPYQSESDALAAAGRWELQANLEAGE